MSKRGRDCSVVGSFFLRTSPRPCTGQRRAGVLSFSFARLHDAGSGRRFSRPFPGRAPRRSVFFTRGQSVVGSEARCCGFGFAWMGGSPGRAALRRTPRAPGRSAVACFPSRVADAPGCGVRAGGEWRGRNSSGVLRAGLRFSRPCPDRAPRRSVFFTRGQPVLGNEARGCAFPVRARTAHRAARSSSPEDSVSWAMRRGAIRPGLAGRGRRLPWPLCFCGRSRGCAR
jgi:hypothetical protein